jgi:hypothetical protein
MSYLLGLDDSLEPEDERGGVEEELELPLDRDGVE